MRIFLTIWNKTYISSSPLTETRRSGTIKPFLVKISNLSIVYLMPLYKTLLSGIESTFMKYSCYLLNILVYSLFNGTI